MILLCLFIMYKKSEEWDRPLSTVSTLQHFPNSWGSCVILSADSWTLWNCAQSSSASLKILSPEQQALIKYIWWEYWCCFYNKHCLLTEGETLNVRGHGHHASKLVLPASTSSGISHFMDKASVQTWRNICILAPNNHKVEKHNDLSIDWVKCLNFQAFSI